MSETQILLDIQQHLHVEQGASTAEIAELLGRKKNTVLQGLRLRGVLRQALGRDIEIEVTKWLRSQGKSVINQRGDAPFDILVDGERVDIKSSHMNKDGRYGFSLQDRSNRVSDKNFSVEFDSFYLVFLDEDGVPVYRVGSANITARYSIGITHLNKTKYPMQLIGYLRVRTDFEALVW